MYLLLILLVFYSCFPWQSFPFDFYLLFNKYINKQINGRYLSNEWLFKITQFIIIMWQWAICILPAIYFIPLYEKKIWQNISFIRLPHGKNKNYVLQHLAIITTSLLFPVFKTILYGQLISLTITTSHRWVIKDLCLVNKNS